MSTNPPLYMRVRYCQTTIPLHQKPLAGATKN